MYCEVDADTVEDRLCEEIQDVIKILKPNLTILHIDNCYQLSTVPSTLGNLTQLRWLNLSYNNLDKLPPEIGKLRLLERLHVNNNRLQELPHELWSLKDLQELQCDTNHLRAIPSGVLEMRKLEKLFVHNNPLLRPEDVADESLMQQNSPQPPPSGDCDQSRTRFRECFVHVSFHHICGVSDVPVAHFLATKQLLEQKRAVCAARKEEELQMLEAQQLKIRRLEVLNE